MFELAITVLFFASREPNAEPIGLGMVYIEAKDKFHDTEAACQERGKEYVFSMRDNLQPGSLPPQVVRVAFAVGCGTEQSESERKT